MTTKEQHCYYCGKSLSDEEMVIKPFPLVTKNGTKRMYKRKFHYECLPKYISKNGNVEARKVENTDWDKVYQYFKIDILGVPEGATLSPHAVERLLGMRVGRYKPNANNTRITKQGYSFRVILLALKFSKAAIDKAIKTVNFKDDHHKVDYIMKIVSNNINFVQRRVYEMDQQNIRIERIKRESQRAPVESSYHSKGSGQRKVFV